MVNSTMILGRFGPFTVYLFGLTVAAGCIVGLAASLVQGRRFGLSAARVFEVAAPSLLAGILGARLAYVLANFSDYRPALSSIWHFNEGGFSFYGGLVAGALVAAWYAERIGLSAGRLLDAAAPGLALGQAIGFVGAQLLGRPTSVPWAVPVDGVPLHPLPAYGMILAYGLFFVTWRLGARAVPVRPGRLFLVYALLHGWGMVIIGTWAAGPRWLGFTGGQWAALAVSVFAAVALFAGRRRGHAAHSNGDPASADDASELQRPTELRGAADGRSIRPMHWAEAAAWLGGLVVLLLIFRARL